MAIEEIFPNLTSTGYKVLRPADPSFNCVAWAAGIDDDWWWPDTHGFCDWPTGAPREKTISAFVRAFATLGFEECDHADTEDGFEKIAIYAIGDLPTHVARQVETGAWTSKLGNEELIEHALKGLEGDTYGRVVVFMKRISSER